MCILCSKVTAQLDLYYQVLCAVEHYGTLALQVHNMVNNTFHFDRNKFQN